MAYCTTDDIYLENGANTGTAVLADITAMIARSDEEIVDMLLKKGVPAPLAATQLKTASIQFTIAKIKRRMSQELSRPNSLNLGGDISFSAQPETEAAAAEAKGNEAIAEYLAVASGSMPPHDQLSVTRSDAVMDDFKLDQSDQPAFFSEM